MEDRTNRVTLTVGSNAAHYQQIFTGFEILAKQGVIDLRCKYGGRGVVAAVGDHSIFYDVLDGCEVDENALASFDSYYKRSYSVQHHRKTSGYEKIKPLGLNYLVYPTFVSWQQLQRDYRYSRRIEHSPISKVQGLRQIVGSLANHLPGRASTRQLSSPPNDQPPRVLFLTRAWEPISSVRHEMPLRQEINAIRAECISLLKERFGSACIAGFAPSAYAERRYPGLIAKVDTSKRNYLKLLRDRATVCVATTGLHGSIGWKFAEYVAFSKAIVSEPLFFSAPGLNEGQHYLEFSDPRQCLQQVERLLNDPLTCMNMREANQQYYHKFLRPDQLIVRTLEPYMTYQPARHVRAGPEGLQA